MQNEPTTKQAESENCSGVENKIRKHYFVEERESHRVGYLRIVRTVDKLREERQ